MSDHFDPSQEFADFLWLALDHGFGSIENGGGPLIPFTMTVNVDGARKLTRYASEQLEKGVALAQESIRPDISLRMYAIAWDGFVTMDGKRTDAIIVEAGEKGARLAAVFCQRYLIHPRKLFRSAKCERIGRPALIGQPTSRLVASVNT